VFIHSPGASALDLDLANDQPAYAAPPGALTWRSAAERNRQLSLWRRAVLTRFGEQTRALRVAWVLESLFNVKRGYAFASNQYLADATGMATRDLQKGLLALEGEAIIRVIHRSRTTTRVMWPRRIWLADGTSTVDVSRHVHHVDVHNLRRLPRTSQLAYARAASVERDRHNGANGYAAAERPKAPPDTGRSEQARHGGRGRRACERSDRPSVSRNVAQRNSQESSEAMTRFHWAKAAKQARAWQAQREPQTVIRIEPDESFWRAWRYDPAGMKASGYSVQKLGSKWVVLLRARP
jgi:hypothetical protein